MNRRRILILHPTLDGDGGGDQVAAWTVEALHRDYDVTLMTALPVDFRAVDAFCGTRLAEGDILNPVASPALERILGMVPMRLAMARVAVLHRSGRRLDAENPFDCIVSTFNEMDFGRPGIQYIHYPWELLPRPDWEGRWYSGLPFLNRAYFWAIALLGGISKQGLRANRSLANSRFIADLVEGLLGTPCEVVYPPVPGRYAPLPWGERRNEVLCLGRVSPEKRVEEVIDIVGRVRERGHDLALRIVGLPETPDYVDRIQALATAHDWIRIELDVPRERLLEVAHRARFGIHAMHEEHFGIAVAEMLRAGCVVFAHDSGGPGEILGGQEDLLFSDADDAVYKIVAMLSGERELEAVRSKLASRAAQFSAERFAAAMRAVVDEFVADQAASKDA